MHKNNMLKVIVAMIIIFFIIPAILPAKFIAENKGTIQSENNFEIIQNIVFSEDELSFDKLFGYDTVQLTDCIYLNEVGEPMIPIKQIKVALPSDMIVTQIEILRTTNIEFQSEYNIFPTQKIRNTVEYDDFEFIQQDSEIYKSMNPYPSNIVEFIHQTDLAGQNIAVLNICPLSYIPLTCKLSLYTSISYEIKGVSGYEFGDYLPNQISEKEIISFENKVKEMVVNPKDVKIQNNVDNSLPMTIKSEDYEYVIITKDDWVDDFEPLAHWKTKKGVPATVVTTSWIYSQYSGSNQQKIRSFIIDAYNDWGSMYFLLGGDTDTVPYQIKYLLGDSIPSDTYYSDFDDDWTCEVNVGRASVRSTSQIDTFIDKVLTYEKNPPLSSYAKNAFFCGFDLWAYGSGEGEDCKIFIKNNYVPSDWTYSYEYDSEVGTHKSDVIAYLNSGNNLVNHADHSYTNSLGVGSNNHGDSLSNTDVSNLYNGDRQSIFYSMGCYACNFEDYTCIGEAFVQNNNGGGIAFIGNSRYGWYNPGFYNTISFQYDIYFFRSMLDQGHYRLGDCFSDHKNDGSTGDDYYKYVFTELTLLGDPELPIWMDNPSDIDYVDYPSSVSTGSQSFTVQVKDGGSSLAGAMVCIQKEDDGVYEYGYTDSTGKITFSINPTSDGNIEVTVTSQDYLPWEGTSSVGGGGTSTDSIFLAGLVSNIVNYQDHISCNANIVFYINLETFKIKVYSSNEDIYLTKDYQGYIGSGIAIGIFEGSVS